MNGKKTKQVALPFPWAAISIWMLKNKNFFAKNLDLQIHNPIYSISNPDGQFHSIHLAKYLPAKTKREPDSYCYISNDLNT